MASSKRSFELFNLPSDVPVDGLADKVAVPVDILRAGTTIATAMDAGALEIHPCVDVSSARDKAANLSNALLGGERHAVLIEGFDLSNSPAAYQTGQVKGRPVVFTTTNGTLAIEACREADSILIGCFANIDAVSRYIMRSSTQHGGSVAVVCAGTDGVPTLEDTLFGGALYQQLIADGWHIGAGSHRAVKLNTAAQAANQMWELALIQMDKGKPLSQLLCETQGGKNLVALNLEKDIEFAAELNRFDVVPVYDPESATIRSDVDLKR